MADIAVLTRNYWKHLSEKSGNPEPTTFYSNTAWKRIEKAHNNEGKDVVVYFAAEDPEIGAGHTDKVTYSGKLRKILIFPSADETELNEMLSQAPDEAAKNAVANGQIKTIYSVSELGKISQGFSQTVLQKVSDGKHVSKDYIRSYCIVKPYNV